MCRDLGEAGITFREVTKMGIRLENSPILSAFVMESGGSLIGSCRHYLPQGKSPLPKPKCLRGEGVRRGKEIYP
jgi:hypothetical protein